MAEDRNEITRRLLDFTLEILYLLTGEDYAIVKKTSGDGVTPIIHLQESGGWSRSHFPITEPPSPIHEQKILELTNKMMELLTGEVPIRCQDVAVYFSMEEWEYIGGRKDLYEDVMMEDLRSFTPQDGSSRRNSPERCPRPLYSQDCPEEDPDVTDGASRRNPPERCPSPLYFQDSPEEDPNVTDGASGRNSPERCPRPLYSQDCPEEEPNVTENHQGEDLIDIKVEVVEEQIMERRPRTRAMKEVPVDVTPARMSCMYVDKEQLISLLQDRPILWDTRREEYHIRSRRDVAWAEVAEQLFGDRWKSARSSTRTKMMEELHKKWRSCRDQYRKELARRSASVSGLTRKRPYYLAPHLAFLRPVLELRPTKDNSEEGENPDSDCKSPGTQPTSSPKTTPAGNSLGDVKDVKDVKELGLCTVPGPSQRPYQPRARIRPRRTREEPIVGRMVDKQILDFLQDQRQQDWVDHFAMSVASSMRMLPTEVHLPLQAAIMTLIELSVDPSSVRILFDGIYQFRLNITLHPTMQAPQHTQAPPPAHPAQLHGQIQ
ncbi:hypothetical protein GDO78_020550 [Eleutherodactylus coqui]|uniref:MADF domain-containing protein n=1 Tax=Eleutherodactylus coqui TaxID=57060 RepID=A0A8J6JTN6_ELECQ|nr:hypothetical protein GDO78_020550 [Eleutherodactylus coqui]